MGDKPAIYLSIRMVLLVIAAIVALAGTFSSAAQAQVSSGAPPPPSIAPTQPTTIGINDPRNPLHLTADQQRKWRTIQMKYQPQAQAIAQSPKLTSDQKKAMLGSLFKKANAELIATLTPTQRAQRQKLAQVATARQAKLTQAIKIRQAQIQKIGNQLEKSLTPAQKAKLTALENQMKPQIQKLQQDQTMTPQQKQAKAVSLGKTYMQERDQILTSEQKDLMKRAQQLQTMPLSASAAQ